MFEFSLPARAAAAIVSLSTGLANGAMRAPTRAMTMKCAAAALAAALTLAAVSAEARGRIAAPSDARECLTLALYHEARSESDASLWKHAWTIVWRVKRDDFPDELCSVVFQRGKFSAFNHGVPPARERHVLVRVAKIADQVLKKAFPDMYGGNECLEFDQYTDACVVTVADIIPTPVGVVTHYAVADCRYLKRPGYDYVRTRGGDCIPKWALAMRRVGSEPCARIKRRACNVVFWKAD